jgi:hypothetical protein
MCLLEYECKVGLLTVGMLIKKIHIFQTVVML